MSKANLKYNKTWEDEVHMLSVNYPKSLWFLIEEERRLLHTSAANVIRTRLLDSFCKDRLPRKGELKAFREDNILEKPKRFQGFNNLLQRHLGFLIRHNRLRENARAKAIMAQIFEEN